MNFKSKNGPPPRVEPEIVSLKQMADQMGVPETDSPLKYAQPSYRRPPVQPAKFDEAAGLIKSFGELPIKEIDDLIRAGDAEWANIKRDYQNEIDRHASEIKRLQDNVKRFQDGVKLFVDAHKTARAQMEQLDSAHEVTATPDDAA